MILKYTLWSAIIICALSFLSLTDTMLRMKHFSSAQADTFLTEISGASIDTDGNDENIQISYNTGVSQ